MFMKQPRTRANKLITLGLFALVAANVVRYVLERKLAVSESIADPVSGFCYGVAIATMLVGIRAQVRERRH
jgi:hypothetical protein